MVCEIKDVRVAYRQRRNRMPKFVIADLTVQRLLVKNGKCRLHLCKIAIIGNLSHVALGHVRSGGCRK